MYDYIPQDAESQAEYEISLNLLKPRVKAAGMAVLNQLPSAKMYSQILARLTLLQEIGSHLNLWFNQIHDLTVSNSALDKQDKVIYESMLKEARDKSQFRVLKDSNHAFSKALNCSGFYDAFDRFRSSSHAQTLSSLKADHAAEVEFCRQCLDQLDIYNTIDHRPTGTSDFISKWGDSPYKVWNRYIALSPAKVLRDHYFLVKYPAAKDEISDMLVKGTISSRRSFTIQRILRAITQFHEAGWYMVFDTLTLADDRLEDFYTNENALRDHFRNVGRLVLEAEGRSTKGSYNDCFQYFAVPEYGSEKGRLHFHAVYFMRTLPLGSVDPNIGRRLRSCRQLASLSGIWPYGFSQPVAVRYSGDAYSRDRWLWPVDKTGRSIPAKPPLAVGYYVAKYVNKQADTQLTLKNLGGTKEWNKQLKINLSHVRPVLFRVRMSRGFGMNTPTMSALSYSTLLEMTQLSKECTPYPTILKQNAKRELRSRLSRLPLFALQDSRPQTPNLLATLRSMTQKSPLVSLSSLIATLTVKLQPTDISKQAQEYLANGNLSPIPFDQRPRFCGGGK